MSSPDFDAPPRDDIHPADDELRRVPVSPAPHPDEFDGPEDLDLDEEQIKRSGIPAAAWPVLDAEAPDYAHLEPGGREPLPGAKRFKFEAADIELLIAANGFDPKGPDNLIVFGLRGALLVGDYEEWDDGVVAGVDSITLEDTRPDHRGFRCTIGYLDRESGTISAFRASTVPNEQYLTNYYMWNNGLGGNSSIGANLLPTGCYVYRMGAHGGGRIYPALRLTDPVRLAEDGSACVIRTKNDLTFTHDDTVDHCTPYDNIHCAYDFDSFSSAGCQTIQGPNGEGPWGNFQSVLLTMKLNTRIDYVLLTGRDAALAAWLRETGKASDPAMVGRWLGRLRPGSRSDAVERLQRQLGIEPTGYFGPVTKKKLVELQRGRGLIADGIWSPRLEETIGWPVLSPPAEAAQPSALPAPAEPPAASPGKTGASDADGGVVAGSSVALAAGTVAAGLAAAAAAKLPEIEAARAEATDVASAEAANVAVPAASEPSASVMPEAQGETTERPDAARRITSVPSVTVASAEAAVEAQPAGDAEAAGGAAVAGQGEREALAFSQLDADRTQDAAALSVHEAAQFNLTTAEESGPVAADPVEDAAGAVIAAPAGTVHAGASIEEDQLARFAEKARPQYRDALLQGKETLTRYGITQSPLRLCHFVAQIFAETGGLTILEEDLTYRSAQRLRAVWPTRFSTVSSAEPYVNNPQKLAERVYGDRFDNRPGDGWRYRGRGLVQLTGRSRYREIGAKLGIDLENQPELASDARHVLAIACEVWANGATPGEHDLNRLADANKLDAITYRLLGAYVGIEERREAFEEAWRIWGAGTPPRPVSDGEVLDRGDRGERVLEVNARLLELGMIAGAAGQHPGEVFNHATLGAVRRLQQDAGVSQTGVMTRDTWGLLEKALDEAATGTQVAGAVRGHSALPAGEAFDGRLREIRAWSGALSLLAVAFVGTYIYALTHAAGNTALWMPLVFAGLVFVSGVAVLLAASIGRGSARRDAAGGKKGDTGSGKRAVRRGETQGFLPGEAEPIRLRVNI
jgi:predicted chitinase/peptidoglycan hydrolase-like protein with peptidoglycan-binding domain